MHRDKIERKILEVAQDLNGEKTITCSDAMEIAKELGVENIKVGKTCNSIGVKVKDCQMGCF